MSYLSPNQIKIILLMIFYIGIHQLSAQIQQSSMPFVQYFESTEYGAGIQNYAIKQDPRGLIIVANNKGLLQYDGSNWTLIESPNHSRMRAILPAQDGKIFIGAQNELGYFFPDNSGKYVYHSLMGLIKDDYITFDNIWNIYPYNDGYVFTGTKEIFVYNNDEIHVVSKPRWNTEIFQLNGKIYQRIEDVGLTYLDDKKWKLHPHGKFFDRINATALAPFDRESFLVTTLDSGIFLVDDHKVTVWADKLANEFAQYKINTILQLKNGSYAVATDVNGLYILNRNGDLKLHLTKGKGLNNRTVINIFEDSMANLWLGHNNGITKIEFNSPFSYLNEESGVSGTGYAAISNNNYTYLGTRNGLFYIAPDDPSAKRIENVSGQIYSLQNIQNDILVGGHFGAYQIIANNQIHTVSNGVGWWKFVETSDPDIAIGGGYAGLFLLKKEKGLWDVKKYFPNFSESSRVMDFDKNDVLWITHPDKGAFAIKFTADFEEISDVKLYGKDHGFPSNISIHVSHIMGKLNFTADFGVYEYNSNDDRFTENKKLSYFLENKIHIRALTEDNFGDIYFLGDNYSGVSKNNTWGYETNPMLFNKIQNLINDDIENISNHDDKTIIIAAKEGFVLYNKEQNTATVSSPLVLFRKVYLINSDSSLFEGNSVINGIISTSQPEPIPALKYSDNSINFNYSAIDYNSEPSLYRFKLINNDSDWSSWTRNNTKEYTNLPEGNYSFVVQAKNVYDSISDPATYSFEIKPPWFRSTFANIIYLILLTGGTVVIFWYNRLKSHKIVKQEEELGKRNVELNSVTKQSQLEIEKLTNDKLDAEVKHKQKELATTAMHLIDKNDFIMSIKSNISGVLKDASNTVVSKELKRIVRDIDRNMKDDDEWSQFELYFDDVYERFIHRLKEEYHEMTPQEIKLSAYLRMNMTTKEIANLLNSNFYVDARSYRSSRLG